jgi:lysozyme
MDGPTLTRRYEGCELVSYQDTRDVYTIGVGHTGPDVFPRQVITQAQADALFDADYSKAIQGAISDVGMVVWNNLDEVRKAVVCDLSFELGQVGLAEFSKTLACIAAEDWEGAAANLLDSAYAAEVPIRAKANAKMLLTGEWNENLETPLT